LGGIKYTKVTQKARKCCNDTTGIISSFIKSSLIAGITLLKILPSAFRQIKVSSQA
jgi:hypothetical protein